MTSALQTSGPPPAPRRRRLGPIDAIIVAVLLAAVAYVVWRAQTVLRYDWNWAPVWGPRGHALTKLLAESCRCNACAAWLRHHA